MEILPNNSKWVRSTIPFLVLVRAFLVCVLVGIGLPQSANADAVYHYTGDAFTSFFGFTCPPECNITGTLTLSQPLAANLSGGSLMPTSFSFTNGLFTIAPGNTNSGNNQFGFFTDSSANITGWFVEVFLPGNKGVIVTDSNGGGIIPQDSSGQPVDGVATVIDYTQLAPPGNCCAGQSTAFREVATTANPCPTCTSGVWTAAAVPEPRSSGYFALVVMSMTAFRLVRLAPKMRSQRFRTHEGGGRFLLTDRC